MKLYHVSSTGQYGVSHVRSSPWRCATAAIERISQAVSSNGMFSCPVSETHRRSAQRDEQTRTGRVGGRWWCLYSQGRSANGQLPRWWGAHSSGYGWLVMFIAYSRCEI